MFSVGNFPEALAAYALEAIGVVEKAGGLRSSTGGLPPAGLKFDWPEFEGRSLSLLATLHLDELPVRADGLPRDGALLFFYDFESAPLGDDYAEAEGWRVIWVPGEIAETDELEEKPANLNDGFVFKARPLIFQVGQTLPFDDHPLFEEVDAPEELLDEADLEDETCGHLGGYSNAADGALYAFRCREQIIGENPMVAYEANLEEVQAAEREMCLLFEYEMEEREPEEASEIFGTRNFSFWAFRADIRQQDFSKVWLRVEID